MIHHANSALADISDGASFSVSDTLTVFRVPKARFRKGNTYALRREDGVVLVDVVHKVTAPAVVQYLREVKLPVKALLITHSDLIKQAFGPPKLLKHCYGAAPVLIHEADVPKDVMAAEGLTTLQNARPLLKDLGLSYYPIPGHTPGSVLYHLAPENLLFAGDGVVGRPYGSDPAERSASHPPLASEDWAGFVEGWASVDEPVAAVLPLHGEMMFGEGSLVKAREAATDRANVMRV